MGPIDDMGKILLKQIGFLFMLFVLAAPALAGHGDIVRNAIVTQTAGESGSENVCLTCHESAIMDETRRKIPGEWKQSWHAQNDVACHDCHGGDPTDAAMAMSPDRGFVGVPNYQRVPEFCGKCHIGILKNYLESGHGKALKAKGSGPNCVTCHGAHNIQKANIDIINEKLCSQCHSYGRAKEMKQALFQTEQKIQEIEASIKKLKAAGVFTEEEDKEVFRTLAEFRTLFHVIDVSLVQDKTGDFLKRLGIIDEKLQGIFGELDSRRNFAIFLLLIFVALAVVGYFLSKTYS